MNKYQEALNALCDEDEMYKLAKGFSFDDDYTSEYDYEKAKEIEFQWEMPDRECQNFMTDVYEENRFYRREVQQYLEEVYS